VGDFVYVQDIRIALAEGKKEIPAKLISKGKVTDITLYVKGLTEDEKTILLEGCLMNYYAAINKKGDK
jgi:aconitate hydratase